MKCPARHHAVGNELPNADLRAIGCRRGGELALRLVVSLLFLAGCDHTRKEVEIARRSLYDADFAEVYSAALEATRQLYPNLDDRPGPGRISTAWHEMTLVDTSEELSNQHTMANASGANASAQGTSGTQGGAASGGTSSGGGGAAPVAMKARRYYIRFDVTVVGGRPWRVKIVGHASSWDAGAAMPTELRAAERPGWLVGRTNALTLAIHRRLEAYAVQPTKATGAPAADHMPKLDPSAFHGLPADAGLLLAQLRLALLRRDYAALRALVADDVIWSPGADGDATAALAVWQADPSIFDAMKAALETCQAESPARVRCTVADRPYSLVVEVRRSKWVVTSFAPSE